MTARFLSSRASAMVTGSPFETYTRTSTTSLLSAVKLLVPVIPPTFYAAGVNYREHVTEMTQRRGVKPEFPPNADVGYRANNALIATDEPIVIPRDATDQVQYEGELAAVVGKRCKARLGGRGARLRLRLHDRQRRQRAHLAARRPDVSQYLTLHPGDVLWMGTDGATENTKDGDVVEIEVPGIVVLRNPVIRGRWARTCR